MISPPPPFGVVASGFTRSFSNAWYFMQGVTYGSQLVGATSVPTITLFPTDGALGDDTAVDGEIVDMGGPGDPSGPVQVPALGRWGRDLLVLMLIAAVLARDAQRAS